MQFWNELEGQTIDGRYPLRRLVRSEGRRAWFETETGPQSTPATISLTEAATDADEVIARLQTAQELKHPNLVSITRVGHVRIDDTVVVYALMEHIEQNLSDVLQSQALSPQEGREVAEALVGALSAIHQIGWSHGHMEAASVLATEETVKLRSDCLQSTTAGQADDVAGIGTILFQAFTQRKTVSTTDAQINRIPAPFAEIVRNSSARRWSLGQIANALKPAVPVAIAAPPPPPPAPEPAPEPAPVAVRSAPPRPAPKAIPVADSVPLPVNREPAGDQKKAARTWIAVLAVALLAILGWFFLRPHPAPAPATPPSTANVTPAPAPAAPAVQAPAAPAPVAKPAATKPSAAVAAPRHPKAGPLAVAPPIAPPAVAPAPSSARSVWRVVVYTYKGETKAADGVARINEQHPDLGASVFNPAGSDVYMVTLGGRMDRSQALALLEKAKREGLPADTYVRNFTQ